MITLGKGEAVLWVCMPRDSGAGSRFPSIRLNLNEQREARNEETGEKILMEEERNRERESKGWV